MEKWEGVALAHISRVGRRAAMSFPKDDTEAFECMFEQYEEMLCRFVRSLPFVSLDDAQDIASETWEKAWRNRASIHNVLNLKAWLRRIASNTAIDYSRKRKREGNRVPHPYLNNECMDEVEIPDRDDFENQVTTAMILDQAWDKTLDKITCVQKACHILYGKDISFKDIALTVGLTEGTVKAYISCVRKTFREEYRRLQEGD